MMDFMTLTTMRPVASDLTKHVNYAQGMVLGVDDFVQEFAYLAGRDRWLARDLLGFGTGSGLQVSTAPGAGAIKGNDARGGARSSRGVLRCVLATPCAL